MSNVIKTDRFICSDIKKNENKFWYIELYDNNEVVTKYGRVGKGAQEAHFPNAGQKFYDKKIREKTKDGRYSPLRTVDNGGSTKPISSSTVDSSNLRQLAINQMARNHPELSKLVRRLVDANIHNIVSSTNITYNSSTGLFSTPLGIVTLDAIVEARDLLVEIKKTLKAKDSGGMGYFINQYLRLVPQDIGTRRVNPMDIFPDDDSIKKQGNILDSLESSYNAVIKSPVTDSKKKTEEQLFQVEMDILNDDKERDRIIKHYESSKRRMHGYDNVKIREIYKVVVAEMDESFKGGKPVTIKEIYHGTSSANLLSILKNGLKTSPPSTAYIAGKMWGNGIYGAIQSSKSLGYTLGKWGGGVGDSGWLFICDFNMGTIYEPTRTCSRPPTGYDSVWAKAEKVGLAHDELVVYDDFRCNIKFLIECK